MQGISQLPAGSLWGGGGVAISIVPGPDPCWARTGIQVGKRGSFGELKGSGVGYCPSSPRRCSTASMVRAAWWDTDDEPGFCFPCSAMGGARDGRRKQTHAKNQAWTFLPHCRKEGWDSLVSPCLPEVLGTAGIWASPPVLLHSVIWLSHPSNTVLLEPSGGGSGLSLLL